MPSRVGPARCGRNRFPKPEQYTTGGRPTSGNCLPHRKFMAYDGSFVSARRAPNATGVVMTMLDRMRRHRNWLKWSLLLVCLAFILFYIPDFLRGTGADAASGGTVATIQGQ